MMPKSAPKQARYAHLSEEQKTDLDRIEKEAVIDFKGQLDELEKAIGMLRLGHHVGWRVLVIAHSKRTIRKYEQILGITFREFFPETGPSSNRSLGYVIASKLENFWKAVSGEDPVPDRAKIEREPIKGS